MLRAATLALVLTLAAGPNVSWICAVLCDQAIATDDCRHEEPAASVIAATDGCCETAEAGVGGFVPQNARHPGVTLDSGHSILVPRSGFGDPLTEHRRGIGDAPAAVRHQQSLSTALRL